MKVEWKTCFRVGIILFLLYFGITYCPSVTVLRRTLLTAAIPLLISVPVSVVAYRLLSERVNYIPQEVSDYV